MDSTPREPPFDPRWLDLLCAAVDRGRRRLRLADLYLERRVEVRFASVGTEPQEEVVRSDGAAARWVHPDRVEVAATTGTSPRALAELLAPHHDLPGLATARPLPPPEIDAPRSWRQWAATGAARLARHRPQVVFLARRAVVVTRDGWTAVDSPDLVRVRIRGEHPGALLAVADHPHLAAWLGLLVEPPPPRAWCPDPGTKLPVVFTAGTAGALVHELVGHLVEADLVASGDSPLAGLNGAIVAPPSITLVDDPTRGDLPGAFDHDDEGVAAAPLTVIAAGTLSGWLCDRHGAERLAARPGRGRRSSWSQPPLPRLSNLILAAGSTAPSELERSLKLGLVVDRLGGATVDPVSGRTVILVEGGWEVRNGHRRRGLGRLELVGDVLRVLAAVDPAVGNDPTPDWRLGWCVKGGWPLPTGSEAPSLLVTELQVL